MMPKNTRSRRGMLIPLVVALVGIALGTLGLTLTRPLPSTAQRLTASEARRDEAPSLPSSDANIRGRIDPSVVDVTAALTYDAETASGTGFAVNPGGTLILTNNHVIRDATSVSVTVPSTGRVYPARIVGVNVKADIAVLQITSAARLPGAPLGDSATVSEGQQVLSFGNQAGAGGAPTVSTGVISGTGRTIQADDGATGFSETLHGMLATTAKIKPGDSGGPLAESSGTVIGVDTAAGTTGAAVGYAIPINTALAAERQIAAGHEGPGIILGTNGYLGVIIGSSATRSPAKQKSQEHGKKIGQAGPGPAACISTADAASTPALIAPAPAGALVFSVLCGTGAATAGITAGDVITAANGHQIGSPNELYSVVAKGRPGSTMSVTWVTAAGLTRTALVKLSTAPAP